MPIDTEVPMLEYVIHVNVQIPRDGDWKFAPTPEQIALEVKGALDVGMNPDYTPLITAEQAEVEVVLAEEV